MAASSAISFSDESLTQLPSNTRLTMSPNSFEKRAFHLSSLLFPREQSAAMHT
jgi:hypothetical protein